VLQCTQQTGFGITHAAKGMEVMNRIIWLVGAIVIILFVLSYFGLR
jgi:hypothetical protein